MDVALSNVMHTAMLTSMHQSKSSLNVEGFYQSEQPSVHLTSSYTCCQRQSQYRKRVWGLQPAEQTLEISLDWVKQRITFETLRRSYSGLEYSNRVCTTKPDAPATTSTLPGRDSSSAALATTSTLPGRDSSSAAPATTSTLPGRDSSSAAPATTSTLPGRDSSSAAPATTSTLPGRDSSSAAPATTSTLPGRDSSSASLTKLPKTAVTRQDVSNTKQHVPGSSSLDPEEVAKSEGSQDLYGEEESSQPLTESTDNSQLSWYVASQETTDKQRASLNDFLWACDRSPVKKSLTVPWETACGRTQRDYRSDLEKVLSCAASVLAPGDSTQLIEAVVMRHAEKNTTSTTTSHDTALQALADAYNNQERGDLKKQTLSIMCDQYSFSTLQKCIPDLTEYHFKAARTHIIQHGRGVEVPHTPITRNRVSPLQVEDFIQFITDFHIQDLPYGEKVMTLSTGEKVEVPNVVLTSIPEHLVRLYIQRCDQTDFEHPCARTLRRILHECSTTYRKSLQGLNYFIAEGSQAFEDLLGICQWMVDNSLAAACSDWVVALKEGKLHLKSQYKTELSDESQVADHCLTHSLSDPQDSSFANQCTHMHDADCTPCSNLRSVLQEIESTLSTACQDQDHVDDNIYVAQQSAAAITAMKSHLAHAFNQDQPRRSILDNLDAETALVTQDWAMKYLPRHFRETQTNWFGKRGLSWHITVVQTAEEEEVVSNTYVHIFDQSPQDASTVVAIMAHVQRDLSSTTSLKSLTYRSDNAGCYHNAFLIWAAQKLSQEGVHIKQVDFSEAQDGKGPCDRKAGQIKSHILRYINQGHDVLTATQMKSAIESNGGVARCKVFVCEAEVAVQKVEKLSLPNISYYSNFELEKEGFRVWKAHGIGPGKYIPWTVLVPKRKKQPVLPQLNVVEGPTQCPAPHQAAKTTPRQRKTADADVEGEAAAKPKLGQKEMFLCPEEDCSASFQQYGRLQRHLEVGVHKIDEEKVTVKDYAKLTFQQKTSVKMGSLQSSSVSQSAAAQLAPVQKGWALKQRQKAARFSDKQKDFLAEKFQEGERTGKKYTPEAAAKAMKTAKSQDGARLFDHTEFMSPTQIQGFWKRFANLRNPKHGSLNVRDLHAATEASEMANISEKIAKSLSQS